MENQGEIEILHLTNTDVRRDNRIIKELEAVTTVSHYKVNAIGVELNENSLNNKIDNKINVKTLRLLTRVLKLFPRALSYPFIMFELNLRLIFHGLFLKPDLLHCHDTMVLPAGTIIKIFTNAKLIYDAHELESNKNGQNKILSKATLLIEKICWPKIDYLITVSNSIIKWYEKELGPKPNSLVLNSPIVKKSSSESNKYFHRLYNIPTDNLVFVYLGILGPGRGIDYILEAFSMNNILSHVVFVGYGDYAAKIENVAKTTFNIHLHNSVPHYEVVSLVKNADVGLCLIENVSLSDYYCLPNKLFEYAFAGLPILASNFPDISAVVQKFNLGGVSAVNTKGINQAIEQMEINPPIKLNEDLTELAWPEQSKRIKDVYLELLKK